MENCDPLARAFLEDSVTLLDQSCIKIQHCLDQVSDDQVWWRAHPETNSMGNLVLHVCGNLRQWTVCGLTGQADVRDREVEFQTRTGWPKPELLEFLNSETEDCKSVIRAQNRDSLLASFEIQGFHVNGLQAINHTVTHFVGHTHQIIYICRTLLGSSYRFAWSPQDERGQLPI